jgi:hypothetical protein
VAKVGGGARGGAGALEVALEVAQVSSEVPPGGALDGAMEVAHALAALLGGQASPTVPPVSRVTMVATTPINKMYCQVCQVYI